MTDGDAETFQTPVATKPGERLRAARIEQGLELADIAARTRIPQRHLESIENGSYSSLPSTTYAIGFARAYARAVDVEETSLAADVRAELSRSWDRPRPAAPYDVGDVDRTPPRRIVWGGVIVALLLLLGVGLWYGTDLLRGRIATPAATEPGEGVTVAIPETVAPPPAPRAGQVVLTATDEVWVRIYDAAGTTLAQRTMAPGERFEVPADANGPMINVGRPDKLAVTINGSAVPPLGDGRVAIRDVPINAEALLARGRPAAAASPAATSPSTATSTSTPARTSTSTSTPASAASPSPRTVPRETPTPAPTTRAFEPAFGNSATPD